MKEIFDLIQKAKAVRFETNCNYGEESEAYGRDFYESLIVSKIEGRNIKLDIKLLMYDRSLIDIKIDSPNIVINEALLACLAIKERF